MSRYIDADAIISFVDAGHLRNPMELAWSDNDVVDMIESRPTVDAVQVVRCKYCKYNLTPSGEGAVCDYDGYVHKQEWFCAYGERRE